jgi:adenylosuccinate synthase
MNAYMIVGGQWGSEGKGLFAGFMAGERKPDAVVSQFGPNAGHTWYEGDTKLVFKSLPVGAIAKSVQQVFLGPGSVINPQILGQELETMRPFLDGKQIWIHEAAAIIMNGDAQAEAGAGGVSHIASTMQGTSEAMIRKIRRYGLLAKTMLDHLEPQVCVVSHSDYTQLLSKVGELQIEGSQGMDLSINAGYHYPYVTSRDCTPAQVLADCGLHPNDLGAIYACIRTFPIRVGHVVDSLGTRVGNSGPCYPDQEELTWEQVGQPDEYTTVTKRVRRVFSFSLMQTQKMLNEVRPTSIMLNFANYTDKFMEIKATIDKMACRPIVRWTGHSAKADDIISHNFPPRKPFIHRD